MPYALTSLASPLSHGRLRPSPSNHRPPSQQAEPFRESEFRRLFHQLHCKHFAIVDSWTRQSVPLDPPPATPRFYNFPPSSLLILRGTFPSTAFDLHTFLSSSSSLSPLLPQSGSAMTRRLCRSTGMEREGSNQGEPPMRSFSWTSEIAAMHA
jgi:hypothetical protein